MQWSRPESAVVKALNQPEIGDDWGWTMIQQQKNGFSRQRRYGSKFGRRPHMLIDFGHFLCINHPFLGSPILTHACMATGEGWLHSGTSRFSKRVRKVRICSCEKNGSSLGISPTIPAEGDPGDPPKTWLAVFSGLRKHQGYHFHKPSQ